MVSFMVVGQELDLVMDELLALVMTEIFNTLLAAAFSFPGKSISRLSVTAFQITHTVKQV